MIRDASRETKAQKIIFLLKFIMQTKWSDKIVYEKLALEKMLLKKC